jgi:hypothetical protein
VPLLGTQLYRRRQDGVGSQILRAPGMRVPGHMARRKAINTPKRTFATARQYVEDGHEAIYKDEIQFPKKEE